MSSQEIKAYFDMAWPLASGALLGVAILIGGWLAAKWANRLVHRAGTRAHLTEALARFLGSIARYAVLAATIIAALGAVGIETTSLLAIFATAGLAIGLALQGSLANFASGVLILFFRPFDLGDTIKAGGETGDVTDIGLFATTLLTLNHETIIVPNSAVTGGNIVNYTRMGTRRILIPVSMVYGTELARGEQTLLTAIASCPLILRAPAPAVALTNFGPSALEFTVVAWSEAGNFIPAQDQARRAIYDALGRAHFDVPFPRTIVEQARAHA